MFKAEHGANWLDAVDKDTLRNALNKIKNDQWSDLGITQDMLDAENYVWPENKFTDIYASGCPACWQFDGASGGPGAPTLTAPFWDDASSAVKQKHAKDTHAANCACPEDGEEEEVEETDPEIGGGI